MPDPHPTATAVHRARARLGEGPSWDAAEGVLWWVDVWDYRVHRWDPRTGDDRVFDMGEATAFAVPARGGAVVGLRQRVVRLDVATGQVETLAEVPGLDPRERINDGKCDPRGRLWFGTQAKEDGKASLWRLDGAGLERMGGDLTIANGFAWSPDEGTMYLSDSPAKRIYAYPFNADAGTLGERHLFADLAEEDSFPDGASTDAEGCLWSAQWEGGCVLRFAPDGRRAGRIELPVPIPTSCAFGGEGRRELYVTTAQIGLGDEQIEAAWESGDLFRLEMDVPGEPVSSFVY
ncbi:MAG TPA: SMP-30/gluconolactonase/LRE family protein [Longimicrobium sp.]|jgi:sugar lactone lactonase YvrE